MNVISELLDIDEPFERVTISGGQTQGFVDVPNDSSPVQFGVRKKDCSGAEYAHLFRQREEEEEQRKLKEQEELCMDPMHIVDDLTSMGTIPNVGELDREELTQVYESYDFDSKKISDATKLGVYCHKEAILNMVRTYRVCVIKGNTGCGKTTQIPQMILDSHVAEKKHCNIVVTQPRRIAAISVAKRVSEERNWPIGSIVGHQVGLEKKVSADTRLTYCTTGVLLQKLISTKNLNDYTHVILDEVHERDQDMDFLMLIVRKFQRTVSPQVKIILMSATINTSAFTQYFSSSVVNEAPVLEIGKKTNFPISVYYLDRLEEKLGPFSEIDENIPKIEEKAYNYVVSIIKAFDFIDEAESDRKGSVLIFLPGIHEIELLYEELETEQMNLKKRLWWICPLHSTITADEQIKAFRAPPAGFRKVILSTNIAESSITVPDIKYVIDFCLTKIMFADPDTNLSSLHLAWASKNQCEQRAGRVGRVMAGRVYRLVSKNFYDYGMEDETKPEILRCPLERVVLKSKLLEMGEPIEILALAMDPPDLNSIEQTILLLKEVGALLLTVNGNYHRFDGDITVLGQVMAALPLDIKISKFIVLGHIFSILEDTIIMACSMTVKSMFSKPFKKDLQAYISKLTWADSTCSDSIACLNAYQLWRFSKTSGKFDTSAGGGAKSWARRFFIQLNAMNEIARLQEEVTQRLKHFGIEESRGHNRVKWDKFTRPLIMKIVLAGAFYPHYFVRSQSGGQVNESDAVKVLGGRDPFSTVYLTNFPPNQPGPLYADAIRKHFLECGVHPSNIKISFDCSSKVYIEFKGSAIENKQAEGSDDRKFTYAIPGKISMAVYRALKMRHYNSSSVNILVLPPQEAKQQMEKIMEANLKKKQEDKASLLPSIVTNFIEIRVSHVLFVDYGNIELVAVTELRTFDPKQIVPLNGEEINLDNEPHLAFNCTLALIQPSVIKDHRAQWSNEANCEFKRLCCERNVLARVYSVVDNVVALEVYIQDMTNHSKSRHYDEDARTLITINEYLVDKKLAEWNEESYLSNVDHDLRMSQQNSETFISANDSWTMNDIFDDVDVPVLPEKYFRKPVRLKGPNSPLEMTLYGCVQSNVKKQISIEQDSVNNILLDTHPHDPHERMLIAASIGQSVTGERLTLRYTTMLPNIHGLSALICLLFSPFAEFRVNEAGTRLTGALCGLGWNPELNEPYFPENDLEVCFDTTFSLEDIQVVNKLRYWMSIFMSASDHHDPKEFTSGETIEHQKKVEKLILELLEQLGQQKTERVESNCEAYKWGQLSSDKILHPGVDCPWLVYRLHYGVHLEDPPKDIVPNKRFKKNLVELKEIAAGRAPIRGAMCDLCQITFDNVRSLKLHLQSTQHNELVLRYNLSDM
ncbi:tudor domain containing 9 protein spindle E isoform X2 [Lycorma delicatula]|uniref:tudor domain containing 9 protein spindle E isoform X2 n=1 Tax=Lycorma delicatula TaxID=130591 RepID=UPI003F519EA8